MTNPSPAKPVPRDLAAFAARPWTRIPKAALDPVRHVPTMLSVMEERLYLWAGEHWASGQGSVVDLGCFAGGSTARLAEGLRRSGHRGEIHAFDRFRASASLKESMLYSGGVPPFEGEDILPLASHLLAPWSERIHLHKGEIEATRWGGGPIEILTVDAAKTGATADKIAEIFFPHLIPEQSLLIQQDFLHWKVPWIPAQMEWLTGYFRPLAYCPRDTIVYLCTRRPDHRALKAAKVMGRADEDLIRALSATRQKLGHLAVDDRLQEQIEIIKHNPNIRRAKDFKTRR